MNYLRRHIHNWTNNIYELSRYLYELDKEILESSLLIRLVAMRMIC